EVADQLLLFGIHRNRRFTRGQSGADLCIDVAELFVPIRTVAALAGLAVALQAVVQLSQQIGDHVVPDAMAHRPQRLSEIAQAATGPQRRSLWTPPRRRLDQFLRVGQKSGVGLAQFLAAAASPAPPPRRKVTAGGLAKLSKATIDR